MATFPPALFELERRLGVDEGSLEGADRERAIDALSDAAALVRAELPAARLAEWVVADAVPDVLAIITLKAARREYDNPQGYVSTSAGDAAARVGVATAVYLTDAEIAQLRRAAGKGRRFVGSIRTPSGYGYV